MEFINKLLHRGSASPVGEAASTTQPGKAEHEVKVQFTREFVDVGSSDSRPESLSSGSSFQSIASTFSTKSGTNSISITAQNVADTSYVDSNIPGLDDLIEACGNIRVNDKTDSEETERYQSITDSTLTLTTNDHSFNISNIDQNISQEEAYRSIINESTNLNGTNNVSSDYKEAGENSINLNATRESSLGNEVIDPDSEPVKDSSSLEEISKNLITNHSIESPNIPQSLVNNSVLGDTSNLSLKSDLVDSISLNKTSELGPVSEKPNENSVDEQACILRSDLLENQQLVNESSLLTVNCNSTINDINLGESEALNVTRDISHDNSLSIDCYSENKTVINANPFNELLVCESNGHISALIDPPNLPPESNICTIENESHLSVQDLSTLQNGHATESLTREKLTINEPDSLSPTPKGQETVKESGNETPVENLQIVSEICTPDSSTDHFSEVINDDKSQTESALSSSSVQESSQNISEEYPRESIPSEEYEKSPEDRNVSTTVRLLEDNKESEENCAKQEISTLLKPEELQEVPQTQAAEILGLTPLHLVSKNLDKLPRENFTEQSPKSLKRLDNSSAASPLSEKIVPSLPQDSLHCLEKFESVALPQITGDVTPFPGVDSDSRQTLTLTTENPSQNSSNSFGEGSDQTVTNKEEQSFHSTGSDGVGENYNAFQPCKQSTSLNSICNFIKLEQAAQVIAEEIQNKSLELNEESDQFFPAEPDLFLDGASFDYLLTRTSGKNPVRDLRAESLYVKFDPLINNASMLPQGPTPVVDGEENAKNSIPQPTLDTPKRNPALAAIDRLLFYSPAIGTPIKAEELPKIEEKIVEDIIPEAVPIVDETMAKELELVRSTVLQLEKEKREQEEELEKQRIKFKEIQLELAQEVQKKNDMTMVMDEYEKSLSRQLADRERERALFEQERAKLQEELQAANHHLGNTEAAFNDVHSKYERLKIIVSGFKNNEDILKETAQENLETIKTLEARYEHLKNHAKSQLEKANAELEAMRKQHETETVRLQAMIRKAELKSNSLAEMVEQKSKENKELTEILDEVIARVGRQPE